ncbi:YdcH family protein [Roseitalea porphyridii]
MARFDGSQARRRRSYMSIDGHLDALKRKHGALDSEINDMLARPAPDESELNRLKREKLRLKDEIEKIMAQTRH